MCRTTRLNAKDFFHIKNQRPCSTIKYNLRSLSTPSVPSKSGLLPGLTQHRDIYLSTSTDPYFNLTVEDWLFRTSPPDTPLLMIYRDSPCVVIGRNQNPWTEVNFPALRSAGIPFIRRRSGGGTVYHDLGNTNFSIHLPRTSFDRHATGRLVLGAVRSLGINTQLNDRNDICVGPDKISEPVIRSQDAKLCFVNFWHIVSPYPPGFLYSSAYKIVNSRAYHHGTMLISTKLSTLGHVLRPQYEKGSFITKGVGSVRSPVCNLQRSDASVSHESFSSAVVEQFRQEYGVTSEPCIVHDSEEIRNVEYIKKGMVELTTWDWLYGQTPAFTQSLEKEFLWGKVNIKIHSRHGLILGCDIELADAHKLQSDMNAMCRRYLEGKAYGFLDDIFAKESADWTQPTRETYSWLRIATNLDL